MAEKLVMDVYSSVAYVRKQRKEGFSEKTSSRSKVPLRQIMHLWLKMC